MKTDAAAIALRAELLTLTYTCPKGQYASRCPFSLLGGLSHASRESVLTGMSYEQMLQFFDLVSSCSCPTDPRNKAEAPAGDGIASQPPHATTS